MRSSIFLGLFIVASAIKETSILSQPISESEAFWSAIFLIVFFAMDLVDFLNKNHLFDKEKN